MQKMKMILPASLFLIAATPATAREERGHAGQLASVARANRNATVEPSAAGLINAAYLYNWADGAVYQLLCAPGAVTDVALQPGEALIAVAAGDTARWMIGDTVSGSGATKRSHILVKPISSGLSTNLLITTDRRSYHLRVKSVASTAMAAVQWSYPQDDMLALQRAREAEAAAAPIGQDLKLEKLSFAYAITGDKPDWRPLRAFDDGRQTFVEFPAEIASGEAPPLFVIGDDRKAELVNYRIRGRFYIVDRLFARAELRLGLKQQQVVRIARIAQPKRKGGKA